MDFEPLCTVNTNLTTNNTVCLALVCFYFCLPYIFLPKKTSKESKKKKKKVKHLNLTSMHVLHIVVELYFGVVEIRVLKKGVFA